MSDRALNYQHLISVGTRLILSNDDFHPIDNDRLERTYNVATVVHRQPIEARCRTTGRVLDYGLRVRLNNLYFPRPRTVGFNHHAFDIWSADFRIYWDIVPANYVPPCDTVDISSDEDEGLEPHGNDTGPCCLVETMDCHRHGRRWFQCDHYLCTECRLGIVRGLRNQPTTAPRRPFACPVCRALP